MLLSCSCITLQDTRDCAVNGLISAGGICVHSISTATEVLSPAEYIDFLEAQPARTCVPVPGFNVCSDSQVGTPVSLPSRGAAISESSADYEIITSELDIMCRELGSKCTLQTQQVVAKMKANLKARLK